MNLVFSFSVACFLGSDFLFDPKDIPEKAKDVQRIDR